MDYDDGEMDSDLCHRCIRPFEPYRLNERIEVRIGKEFEEANIIRASANNETYAVLLKSGETLEGVSSLDIRRAERRVRSKLSRGMNVFALFDGIPDEWFPGVIVGENSDGTFAIEYDDGDHSKRVRRKDIRLA